jgi:hypothetical protein
MELLSFLLLCCCLRSYCFKALPFSSQHFHTYTHTNTGLNAMGGKAKAGCPKQNIQATLNSLTDAGLSVAVQEEIQDVEETNRKSTKLKHRGMAFDFSFGVLLEFLAIAL